ncbi:MAG: DNA-processing protein DprA [Oceanospirillales bacterium]|nr:DNA-processing protein DprA [Oceanospirillales bacterium]
MISENTKAILLLTSFFTPKEPGSSKILSINEYGYFACWLNQNGYTPVDLLNKDLLENAFSRWKDPSSHAKAKEIVGFSRINNTISSISFERIKSLIGRGAGLSLALDKWQSAGIWIMDRTHPDYPISFKKHLKHQSPALLFGIGDSQLLNKSSIGIVGSRHCSSQDEIATRVYVEKFNALGHQVVSGGAKGIDTCAMLASLESDSTAIGVLADSLFQASASNQWRQYLKNNQLVLISPFYPEGRFTTANAMGRNKYIYLLSQATVVVTSSTKGGTWDGAKENLKNKWVPLIVSTHQEELQAGNKELLNGIPKAQESARPITINDSLNSISNLISSQQVQNTEKSVATSPTVEELSQDDLFSVQEASTDNDVKVGNHDPRIQNESNTEKQPLSSMHKNKAELSITVNEQSEEASQESVASNTNGILSVDCHELLGETPLLKEFYMQISDVLLQQNNRMISKDLLVDKFPEFEIMGKTALDKWLKHLVDLGLLIKPHTRKKEYSLPKRSISTR